MLLHRPYRGHQARIKERPQPLPELFGHLLRRTCHICLVSICAAYRIRRDVRHPMPPTQKSPAAWCPSRSPWHEFPPACRNSASASLAVVSTVARASATFDSRCADASRVSDCASSSKFVRWRCEACATPRLNSSSAPESESAISVEICCCVSRSARSTGFPRFDQDFSAPHRLAGRFAAQSLPRACDNLPAANPSATRTSSSRSSSRASNFLLRSMHQRAALLRRCVRNLLYRSFARRINRIHRRMQCRSQVFRHRG